MSRKIIIAGGGTGGHIFPAIAIAGALKKIDPGIELLFVGAKGKMEMEKVPQAGYNIEGIDIAGLNRSSLIKNIGLPFKLVKSFFQVRGIIRRFMPDAVVGVGGYSSFPVLRAAQSKGIPTFIHESNSFAGKANQWLGKKATGIFVASDGMEKFFPAEKIKVTGNPVRAHLTSSVVDRATAIRSFGLDPDKPTLLCTGGSLGARGINEAIAAHLEEFAVDGVQLIWQTGKPFAQQAATLCSGRPNIWTADFITKMEYAFAAGDVVISRSGAMSIAELCVAGKAAVFVPFPFAAEDHQTANAQRLVDKGAGILVKDSEAKEKLVATAIGLLKDEARRRQLEENIHRLAVTNADEVIAEEILKQCSN
ncbi:undecaprenyldiphospho-muramoylpentapeptide beta-N-acetylglucosaminyltransferase [Flavitalea sp. BT771]|uniref:undecaprenyldiphospho-muramoylpentapeptide beta-N-acetylglucosaminyltransferase n=1 Tax=Flavitalea sp. BT771 TaxID=3063329 RepID=UPI0026E153BE|nr:undecaprenyldiphospho-muramoylpentapeptide beta-N-acetylglucosaminyltransferase [Flavitalea sp. BT771]MDO6435485.1 undecaprenyldiphospho-muramoylpentapeptide beta-N-acetylglucosaminyltransferase [Flavitalea sp. BT771]MDV6224385.1 undecaprenyldiphospho-muramoylpentapeptide beta-N-acetylglucosaminyltransferase [Flavitalea sp. BT771]